MRHAFRITPLAVLALLAGCEVGIPIGDPAFSEPEVATRAESLRSPLTTRQQVQAALGAPASSAPDGSADVFHVTDVQRQLTLIGVFPAIIPVPGLSIRHTAYTLVAYDASGNVTAVDAAYRRTDSATELQGGVVLRADDYEFVHGQTDLLLIAPDRYFTTLATDGSYCTVLAGCGHPSCSAFLPGEPAPDCGVCWTRLQVDDGPVQEVPLLQVVSWRFEDDASPDTAGGTPTAASRCEELGGRAFNGSVQLCILSRYSMMPLRLSPGRHRLVATSKPLDGEARGEFECAAGEVVYAALDGEVTQRYSFSKQLGAGLRVGSATGSITFSPESPPGLEGQRVILNW